MEEEINTVRVTTISIVSIISGAIIVSLLYMFGYKFEDCPFTMTTGGTLFFFGVEVMLLDCYIYYKNKHIGGENKE